MKFVNRQQELARSNRLVHSGEAGVAVIWGRRRVGKTAQKILRKSMQSTFTQ